MSDPRVSIEPFFQVFRMHDAPPEWFQVLGERSSGTNLADRLLRRNIAALQGDALGWKHGFPHVVAIPRNYLVVAVVRNALSWAHSMYGRPWHTSPNMQALDFSGFIRAPWDTIVDRGRYFGMEPSDARIGEPLQLDRHPLTGERFAHLLALRNAKIAALLGLRERGCNLVLVQLEEIVRDTGGFVSRVADGFGLARKGELRLVERRLGQRFKASIGSRQPAPREIADSDWRFILEQLDLSQESAIGYSYAQ